MIHPAAVKEFLKAPRDSHAWVKKLSNEQLDAELARIGYAPPRPKKPLDKHQKACLLLGIAYKAFSFWLDMGCVDCETEYLSPTGWHRMDSYTGGKVAQYIPETGCIEFVKPSAYVVKPCHKMFRFKTRFGVDQKISEEHKVLCADYKGKPYKISAADLVHKATTRHYRPRFYTTYHINQPGVGLSNAELRLQVAIIADGNFKGKKCHLRVQKIRKIKRARALLRSANISFVEVKEGPATNFKFVAPRKEREFGSYYWKCSAHQLKIIAEEVFHWDGSVVGTSDAFYTTSKASANFVQFALAASGRTTSLKVQDRGNPKHKPLFILVARKKAALVELRGRNITEEKTTDGKKYCFEVPSGYLLFRRSGNIFASGNTGKTRLMLELLNYLMDQKEVRHALILVESEAAVFNWENQIKQWRINKPYVALGNAPTAEKWSYIDELPSPGFIICTYRGLVWLVSKRKPRKKRGKVVKRNGKVVMRATRQASLVDRLAKNLDVIVADESPNLGNQGSLIYMAVRALRKKVGWYYNLAGRPFGKDPEMNWTQQWLVDFGESLGDTVGLFRAAFCNEKRGYFGGYEYTFKPEMEDRMAQLMAHRSISYDESECGTTAKVKVITEKVRPPEDAKAYYAKAIDAIRRARGDVAVKQNMFLRMRQLSSGFIGFKDDETGERAQIVFPVNPKLERLTDLVAAIPLDRKFVIFHEFTHSGRVLCDKLKQMGIGHAWLRGGIKNTKDILHRFDNDPKLRGLVVNTSVGSTTHNFQVANYQIDYENPPGVIKKQQMDKRLPRKGQTRTVYRYELTCFPVDQEILDFHATGQAWFENLYRRE